MYYYFILDSPQISSFENTVTLTKNSDEVKNNSVNTEKNSINFSKPISNGPSFSFGISNPITKVDELSNNSLKPNKPVEETKNNKNEDQKSQSFFSKESENTPNCGEKSTDFKLNEESFKSSLTTNKTPEFIFNDKKTSPLSNVLGTTFSTPSFSFGKTIQTFAFKPMEQPNDKKPFFSFGSVTQTPVSDLNKNDDVQKSKDEDDEDQPPVVNFTPIKENDAVFESKSKLYYLKDGKYEEHGVGQLYLKPIDDKKIQLIMRSDNTLGTIMLNTLLNGSINFTKRNAKNVQLICILDSKAENPKPQTVLFKFKDSQVTDSFENELSKLKD